MKRPSQDVAGRPRVKDARLEVAGAAISRSASDVARHENVPRNPRSTAADDLALRADFADFLIGDEGFEAARLPAPDPAFRQRLRRRLWKNYVVSHLRNVGKETH